MRWAQLFLAGPTFFATTTVVAWMPLVGQAEHLRADEPTASDEDPEIRLREEARRKGEPILATMAKDHGYGLSPGQSLRRVKPPNPAARSEYYRTAHPRQAEGNSSEPEMMTFHHRDGKLTNWSMSYGGRNGFAIRGLLGTVLKVDAQKVEGGEVLDKKVEGDWVIDSNASQDQLLQEFEAILRKELALPIRIPWRSINRQVYVASGDYQFTSIVGGRGREEVEASGKTVNRDPIEIYGKEMTVDDSGSGVGDFDALLSAIGTWVDKPIVSDLTTSPTSQFVWRLHQRRPGTEATHAEDHDPMLILPSISQQTGLKFSLEQRPIKTLFVEETP